MDRLAGTVRTGDSDPVQPSLVPQVVALDLDVRGKIALLEAAAKLLEPSCRCGAEPIFRALHRREQAGSTGVGHGLAIPHGRIPGIEQPLTLFVRTRSPIRFGAPDGKPVPEFFVILVPAEGPPETHLQLLCGVAELFSQPAFRATLAGAANAAAVTAAFARWTGRPDNCEVEVLQGLS
jgi:nitrogen PTS system EIIA component